MAIEELGSARLLLVDPDEASLTVLEQSLHDAGAGCTLSVSSPHHAKNVYREFKPDLVMLNLLHPPAESFALIEEFRTMDGEDHHVPVILMSYDTCSATKQQALEAGVADFLHKELDRAELILRVRNVIRTQRLYKQVQRQKSWLEETVRVRTRQLQAARREVIERLALAAEFRDDDTGEHTRRVGKLSAQIAQAMIEDAAFVDSIGAAALLHDLGKIGIPDSLLLKQGPLTQEERKSMQEHTLIGAAILTDCSEVVMKMAREIALTHHERWDGAGYPNGLSNEQIPLCGRIVSVADAFDAMISERPYKKPMRRTDAIEEIVACSGKQFDPRVVQAFLLVQQKELGAGERVPSLRSAGQPELALE